jgi:hypothetical protein
MTLEYSQQTFEKFHKNPSNRTWVVPSWWMDRQTDRHLTKLIVAFQWSQWPCSLRRDSAVARLLECGFESDRRHGCLPLVSVVCWQVEVSASGCSFTQRSSTGCHVSVCDCEASIMLRPWPTRAGLTNLRHTAFTAVPIFYLFCLTSLSKLWRKCVYTHTFYCTEAVYEFQLLPYDNASETFLQKSRAVQNVDWIFITGALGWRWLGEYNDLISLPC